MKKRLLLIFVLALTVLAVAMVATACDTPTATVHFDLGEAEGVAPQDVTVKLGEEITLPTTDVSIEGKSFAGWTCSADGSVRSANSLYQVMGDVTFTARWRKVVKSASITLDFNSAQGSVGLTKPAAGGDEYSIGETVTVVVRPASGYAVQSFEVSGYPYAALTEGLFSFEVTGDVTISVAFYKPTMSSDVLGELQSSLWLEGKYTNNDYFMDEVLYEDILCVFDVKHSAIWQRNIYDGDVYFNAVYVKYENDGADMIGLILHDHDGKLNVQQSQSPYADFDNPFAELEVNDLEYVSAGTWRIPDLVLAKRSATAITGYEDDIESFILHEEGGHITDIKITAKRVQQENADHQYIYEYEISKQGTAELPSEWFDDYVETEDHAALRVALETAASKTDYTVQYHSVSANEEDEDLDYTIYVTPENIYEDCPGYESGYIERADGNTWGYSYDPRSKTAEFVESYPLPMSEMGASFVLDDIAYCMLEYVGDGVYKLHDIDIVMLNYISDIPGALAGSFAIGADRKVYFDWAFDVLIKLKDGVLWQVEVEYDYNGYVSERVTMTFDFSGATIPVQIEDNGVYTKYAGSYKSGSDDVSYELDITSDAVTVSINGEAQQVEVVSYSDRYGFELVIGDTFYTLNALGDPPFYQLQLTPSGGETIYLVREQGDQPPVVDPGAADEYARYIGTFEGEYGGKQYTLTIGENNAVSISIDGVEQSVSVVNFDMYQGFTIKLNGEDYYLFAKEYAYEGDLIHIYIMSEDHSVNIIMTRAE